MEELRKKTPHIIQESRVRSRNLDPTIPECWTWCYTFDSLVRWHPTQFRLFVIACNHSQCCLGHNRRFGSDRYAKSRRVARYTCFSFSNDVV